MTGEAHAAALIALARHLDGGEPLPAGAREILQKALAAFLAGRFDTLDRAFGFTGEPGRRTARTMAVLAERDRLLRDAAAEFWPHASVSEQARCLCEKWTRYAVTGWRHERALPEPPAGRRETVEARLWRVMRLRDHVIAERSVRALLAASDPYSLPTTGATMLSEQET